MENLIWALIVVTAAGNVSFSTGYPSRALCEDAISISKTGKTVAEKKAADDDALRQFDKRRQEYEAAHPPRPTTADDKKNCFNNTGGHRNASASFDYCAMEKDGMTRFYANSSYGGYITSYPELEIKFAKCVMVNPSDK